jgi:hypothetical protein
VGIPTRLDPGQLYRVHCLCDEEDEAVVSGGRKEGIFRGGYISMMALDCGEDVCDDGSTVSEGGELMLEVLAPRDDEFFLIT